LITAAMLLIGYLIASEERSRQTADEANRKLAMYAAQVEGLATANERNRLAREIHDNLGHYLSAVNMQIEAAVTIIERDPERAVQTLRKAQGLAKDGLGQIRDSVATLRADPTQERPLHEALTRLVDEGRADGLTIDYQVKGNIRPCAGEIEMALYRIVQEGLTNIRKHAQATLAEVELCYDDNQRVRLKVKDNGRGKSGGDGGFGLLGIEERVKLMGGTLAIQTAPGQGFSLEVEISA
ncbi:MAG: sensor histidine kinase, partial [Anaerolineae bacterium]|nr:sensor histidine kinase [Anaerolineae bacterium]